MFRMSGSLYKNAHILKSCVSRQEDADSRTKHVMTALKEICEEFDLAVPIWLDSNIQEFKRKSKCSFYADSFVETIDFDRLDIEVIEE